MANERVGVKVCGVTRADDARLAVELGARWLGLNFHPGSPRCVGAEQVAEIRNALADASATPSPVGLVGVFVTLPLDETRSVAERAGLDVIQLHGEHSPEWVAALAPAPVIRAFRWRGPETAADVRSFVAAAPTVQAILLDAYHPGQAGGTGSTWRWQEARDLVAEVAPLPVFLAGGLTSENVAAAIEAVHPHAVDVASGVESSPGVKCPEKLRAFFAAIPPASG